MSPKLPRVTARELIAALRRDGWEIDRQSGSHAVLTHPVKRGIVVVPNHRGSLAAGTIADAVDKAGLTTEAFIELL